MLTRVSCVKLAHEKEKEKEEDADLKQEEEEVRNNQQSSVLMQTKVC